MSILDLLFSGKFLVSLFAVVSAAVICSFLPLAGILGYEYSVIIAILTSYIAVFLSSESLIDPSGNGSYFAKNSGSNTLTSVFLVNLVILSFTFLIGLAGSHFRSDCSFDSGIGLFLLIPVVSVIFSTAVGAFSAALFGKRGFITGAIILTVLIFYSVFQLYYQPHLFIYNPVFGYFPGPIYDKVIPVTQSLVLYRGYILLWAFLLITIVCMKNRFSEQKAVMAHVLIFMVLSSLIVSGKLYSQELGFGYSRDYITEKVLEASYETENFKIYYMPDTRTAGDIELIAADHEWRYKQVSEYLGVDPEQKIVSYIYPDMKVRGKYIGAYSTTLANPIHKEIHLVYDSFPHQVLKHELVHVLAAEFGTEILRISPGVGLIEGVAVAADWSGGDLSVHQWARLLMDKEVEIDIADMMGISFWFQPSLNSYTLMGSFCRFLIDKYGIDKFKTFYRTGSPEIYGMGFDELSAEWQKFLLTLPRVEFAKELAEFRYSEKAITQEHCPREKEHLRLNGLEALRNGKYTQAVTYLESASVIARQDPDIRVLLSYAYYYGKDYTSLLHTLNSDVIPGEIDNNILRNLRGNVTWDRKGYTQALSAFRDLADKPLPEDIRREIEIKTGLYDYDQAIRTKYLEFLKTNKRTERLVILQEIVSEYDHFAPGYYKLGELFFETGDYRRASRYTKMAEARGLSNGSTGLHNLEILGLSLYATGDYAGSVETFRKYGHNAADNAKRLYARNFINRVKWTSANRINLNK